MLLDSNWSIWYRHGVSCNDISPCIYHCVFFQKWRQAWVSQLGMTTSSSSWSGDILVFPHIVTNYGNGYNPRTGKFTAPTDGTYVFFVHVNALGSNFIYLDIVINGSSKVRTLAHNSAQFRTGTNMAVLQLVIGDSVWVCRYNGQSYYTHSVPITTFSGFLCWKLKSTKNQSKVFEMKQCLQKTILKIMYNYN